jgi:alpha-beta hydrolase superfamily lysophospholipase
VSSLLDHPTLSGRYFYPRPDVPADPFWVVAADGRSRLCCWRAPPPAEGALTVLHFHGNGEVVADFPEAFGPILAGLGVGACFAEYRGYGGSTGTPSLTSLLDDAHAVADALGVPDRRLVAFGRSLGSLPAIELAARRPLAGLILESGIADPLERILLRVTPEELGGTHALLAAEASARLDHRRKLEAFAGPLLVLHAARDSLVDRSHAERTAAWGRGQLVMFPRGDHNSIFAANADEYLGALRGFLKASALPPAKRPAPGGPS